MSTRTSRYRLGLFILTGIGLLAATIIYLGVGTTFRESIVVESYFDESVQGLDVGGAVKFRGVKVGTVKNITFAWTRYPNADELGRYVLVDMALDKELVTNFFGQRIAREKLYLRRPIELGLRARLTTQGLTGVAFLELNFFDPEDSPPLPISWEPENPYIPSAPSTMSRLEAAMDSIGDAIKEIEFQHIGDTLAQILDKVNTGLDEADVATLGGLIQQDLLELRKGLRRVNTLLSDPRLETIVPDAAAAVAGARRMVDSSEENFVTTFQKARNVSSNLERASVSINTLLEDDKLGAALSRLPGTIEDISAAAQDIRRSMKQLERTLRGVGDLTESESANIRAILQDTRRLMDNLNAVAGEARQNPARLILGAPPKRIDPEKLP